VSQAIAFVLFNRMSDLFTSLLSFEYRSNFVVNFVGISISKVVVWLQSTCVGVNPIALQSLLLYIPSYLIGIPICIQFFCFSFEYRLFDRKIRLPFRASFQNLLFDFNPLALKSIRLLSNISNCRYSSDLFRPIWSEFRFGVFFRLVLV